MSNKNVTRIERLSSGMVKLYNRSNVIGAFSALNSISIGYENNNARTIQFTDNGNTISFQVFNLQEIVGSINTVTYIPIDTTSTGPDYNARVFEVFDFLSSQVFQGFSPGPTYVGGVVAVYPNFASFPATGQEAVIYIDESMNQAYFWDGSSYQLLTSTGVETYPNFASFPATGVANIIYVDLSVPESYVWDGSVYVSLDGGSVAWGSIIGTLSAQTDLQAALDAKFDDPTGTTAEYIRGDGSLATFPAITSGTVTSVGLKMPSAFNVANSPITTSGLLDVTGAGTVSQYVRGDGSLANFPASSGGGSSLTFYLNGSVAQGTFGGVAMKEMDRVPVLGAGTDFTIATNGYIQSFITDANVPNLLEIPAGNWNFETYFSASSGGGSPSFYIELYKWDGATLSLIASNSATPEGITNGTAIDLYLSAIAVPQTTLALTDRLAVRIYVNNSGRTIKLHTENSHLCEVITTFSTGLTALNGLTAQVQNFATGTSGTDFGISSATSTHTFNLPTASAANRGALSSADWTTFNSKVPATRSLTINGTTQDLSADRTFTIATGLTVGTTPITSGTVGRVLFEGTGNVLQESANFFWDNTNGTLSINPIVNNAAGHRVGLNILSNAISRMYFTSSATGVNWNAGMTISSGTATPRWTIAGYGSTFDFTFFNETLLTDALFIKGSTNNVIIGGSTDAGFKLDVNGTFRVQGRQSITSDTSVTTQTSSVIQATTTNANLVLTPNGTGAILASIPDGTAVGGNARGTYALDLQRTRTNANQVPPSYTEYSTILNGRNNASNGNHCQVLNGVSNTVTYSSYSTVINGSNCVTTGDYSMASGQSCTSRQYGFTHGINCTNSGDSSVAFGGGTIVSGNYSFGCGNQNQATGLNSFVSGYRSIAYLKSQRTNGHTPPTWDTPYYGLAQSSELVASSSVVALTSGATTDLTIDGDLIIPLGTNRFWNVEVKYIAIISAITGTATGMSVGSVKTQDIQIGLKKYSGTSSLVGSGIYSTAQEDSSMSTSSLALSIGGSQNLRLTFTAPTFVGGGSVTIRVVARIELTEVAF